MQELVEGPAILVKGEGQESSRGVFLTAAHPVYFQRNWLMVVYCSTG